MAKKDKEQVLSGASSSMDLALAAIEKVHGKGAVMFGNMTAIPGVEFHSSGCLSLDKALGGGWPRGRIVEIYGPESSGKTTLALHALAAAMKKGYLGAFVDVEHAFDPHYAESIGIDMSKLAFSQPSSGEEALQVVEMLVGAAKIIVVDSVAALLPQAEIEKDIGDATVGRQAGLMSQALRKLAGKCHKADTTLIFINQIRMKIGVMFGNPETVSGGNALKFYASQRVDVRRTNVVKEGEDVVASHTKAKIIKNKVAPPFREAEFDIRYGTGIDIYKDLLDNAVTVEVIKKAGAWYSYGEEKLGCGAPAACAILKARPDLFSEIWDTLQKAETPIKVSEDTTTED